MTIKNKLDKESTRKDIFAEKLPTVIQSKTVQVTALVSCNFSLKIRADKTKLAKTDPQARIVVTVSDKFRLNKPIIAQETSGNKGIK